MKTFLRRSLADAEVIPIVLVMAAVLAIAVGATFLAAGFLVQTRLADSVNRQVTIRQARVDRARVLTLQLDEETGLRGFAATGSTVFLETLKSGRKGWKPAVADLRRAVESLDPADVSLVDDQDRLNAAWLRTVAGPVVTDVSVRNSAQLHLYGKHLVDRFRQVSNLLSGDLDRTSQRIDAASLQLVDRIVIWAAVAGVLIVGSIVLATIFIVRILEETRLQRQAYEEEKRIADLLQEAFVQKALPTIAAVSLDAVYVPAGRETLVGGDWYDAFELPDKRILFSIGDVCGHGVEAAIVMSRARQAILSAGMTNRDPAAVLALTNDVLMMLNSPMVTAACGYIDPHTLTITYATAGHPPPILAHPDGSTRVLPGFGPPLAVLADPAYRPFSEQGLPDALLVLYTDGLVEYGRDLLAGEELLVRIVGETARSRAGHPARRIFEAIFAESAPVDDVALLVAAFARN